jgi:hypothetical protein
MTRQKQSGCQHLSPKTGNWEPCVGPENCDYRKQGLDVPHAYSQTEREAINAERAGVDDAGLGGSRSRTSDTNGRLKLSVARSSLPSSVLREIKEIEKERKSHEIQTLDDPVFHEVPDLRGAVVNLTEPSGESRRIVVTSGGSHTFALEGIDLDTGEVTYLGGHYKNPQRKAEVVDYPRVPESVRALMSAEIDRDRQRFKDRQERILDTVRKDLGLGEDDHLKISSYGDGSGLIEISGRTGKWDEKNEFSVTVNRFGHLAGRYSRNSGSKTEKRLKNYLRSNAGKRAVAERYDTDRGLEICNERQRVADESYFKPKRQMYRDGEVDEIARRKAVSINSAIKSRRSVSQSHARLEITDSVPSKMDPVLGKDKQGFYVISVNDSPSKERSRVRILSQSQGGSTGSFASDSVGSESEVLVKAVNRMSPETIKELYDSHQAKFYTPEQIKRDYYPDV